MGRKSKTKEELDEIFTDTELLNIANYLTIRNEVTEFDVEMYGKDKNEYKDRLLNTLIAVDDQDPLIEKIEKLSIPESERLIELAKERKEENNENLHYPTD
ncbi:hypothetical protein [Planococcus maritimus]|uniref:hypothetical protein n=1 Tax=Planococcus maritimus TaxID=192421 RepID=UPI000794DB72|nr:hypothetical protein [Planococcus maritimus]KYG70970.1 hypothetical protein AY633_15580 [Planococcus maritimus]